MEAMTIFRRCRAAEDEIQRIQVRISQRWDALTGIGAPQADPNGGSRGGGDTDKTGRIMGDIDQLEREVQARREALQAETVAALTLLDAVPDLENEVLYLYYLKRMSTGEIAKEKSYTPGYVRKVKRDGEQLLAMLSPDRVRASLPAWYLEMYDTERRGAR